MRKSLPASLVLLLLLPALAAAQATAPAASAAPAAPPAATAEDQAAVRQAALDYIEGYYGGDPVRMERGLHPELVKRGVTTSPRFGGAAYLPAMSKSNLVTIARAGTGKRPPEEWDVTVAVLDVAPATAAVKVVSVEFVDQMLLAKVDGKWSIIAVLWEPRPKPAAAP